MNQLIIYQSPAIGRIAVSLRPAKVKLWQVGTLYRNSRSNICQRTFSGKCTGLGKSFMLRICCDYALEFGPSSIIATDLICF